MTLCYFARRELKFEPCFDFFLSKLQTTTPLLRKLKTTICEEKNSVNFHETEHLISVCTTSLPGLLIKFTATSGDSEVFIAKIVSSGKN